jgi:hypothetical protein
VPLNEIVGGGPPKDGIPTIDTPRLFPRPRLKTFCPITIGYLESQSAGAAKAYPIRILNWHEIVNDDVNGHPITVTW